jgi:hypothetical protein
MCGGEIHSVLERRFLFSKTQTKRLYHALQGLAQAISKTDGPVTLSEGAAIAWVENYMITAL